MVVDAALTHRVERLHDGVAIGWLAGAFPRPPQQFEDSSLWKLRRGADPAVQLVGLAQQALGDSVEQLRPDPTAALRSPELLQGFAQRGDILCHVIALLRIGVAYRVQ